MAPRSRSRRASRLGAGAALLAVALGAVGCGGGSGAGGSTHAAAVTTAATALAVTTSPPTTQSPIQGVRTYSEEAGHSQAPVRYPEVPPVGGVHNPVWQPCAFYDAPIQSEMGVHSLEHGAIWITYRADLPTADVDQLAALARSRKDILVSRWDDSLPSSLVVTAWGRQLLLQSFADPRLAQFVSLYANQGPERNAPC